MMFSSRTLADRNNDPKPYKCGMKPNQDIRHSNSDVKFCSMPVDDPRTEFQHGALPVNRVLAAFRRQLNNANASDEATYWLESLAETSNAPFEDCPPAEIDHAHRVLTLLSKLT